MIGTTIGTTDTPIKLEDLQVIQKDKSEEGEVRLGDIYIGDSRQFVVFFQKIAQIIEGSELSSIFGRNREGKANVEFIKKQIEQLDEVWMSMMDDTADCSADEMMVFFSKSIQLIIDCLRNMETVMIRCINSYQGDQKTTIECRVTQISKFIQDNISDLLVALAAQQVRATESLSEEEKLQRMKDIGVAEGAALLELLSTTDRDETVHSEAKVAKLVTLGLGSPKTEKIKQHLDDSKGDIRSNTPGIL